MLIEKIDNEIKVAIKNRDLITVNALRMFKNALQNAAINQGKDLKEEQEIEVLKREAKKRKEAITEYQKANRTDLANKEQAELDLVNQYLPADLSEDKIIEIIQDVIKETGAQSLADLGQVIPKVMARVKSQADGGQVAAIVKQQLQ